MAIDRGKSQTSSLLTGTVWRTLTQPATLVSIQTAASEVAQLALIAQEGDVVIRSDEDKVYMHNSSYAGTMADWTAFAVTDDYVDDKTHLSLIDEDNMATDSATRPPSQQSVKAYVDNQITAEDLDFIADSGGALSIDLDSEVLSILGTGGQITTSGAGNAVTLAISNPLVGITIPPLLQTASITGSTTLNFTTYNNFVLTLTGNVTLQNPVAIYEGQSGYMAFIQDGSGSRTITLGTDFETVGGGGLELSSVAGRTDLVPYFIAAAPGSGAKRIMLGTAQIAFS